MFPLSCNFFGMFSEEEFQLAFFKDSSEQNLFVDRLKEMVLALLSESDLSLSDDLVELIVEKTMVEADSKGDGKIDEEEWREFVKNNQSIIKNMTLPYLNFVLNNEVSDQE
ncbi:hypothetical protein CRYUN_Cryun19dG0111700 [Craigia yunnanensis]